MSREVITGTISAIFASLVTFLAISFTGLLEKNITNSQIEKIASTIVDKKEYRNTLIERMEESGRFKGEKGDKGDKGQKGNKGERGDGVVKVNGSDQMRFKTANGNEIIYIGIGLSSGEPFGGYILLRDLKGERYATLSDSGLWTRGNDYADVFELATRDNVLPGTVMSVTSDGKGIAPSEIPYDRKVVGIISGAGNLQTGTILGRRKDGSTDLPVAVAGQVYVRVSLEGGAIQVGDLLVSSSTPGVAMKATDQEKAFGTVVGKAIEPYNGNTKNDEGLVKMLILNK